MNVCHNLYEKLFWQKQEAATMRWLRSSVIHNEKESGMVMEFQVKSLNKNMNNE